MKFKIYNKHAKNGLQSRSSENGKTVVWHYGLKKVSSNVHSDEIENNHQEAQIKCQKSINEIFCIPVQL